MRKITSNTPRRVIIAILAAAMTFSAVSAGITPLCAPVVVYAGNTENNAEINSHIGFNSGDNVTVNETGSVDQNQGNVSTNNGTITDNQNTGDVDVNNGTITTNNGNVDNNSSTGTIGTNALRVVENNGNITTNANGGTVTDNFGNVGTNNGTVINNFGGTVESGNAPANQFYSIGVSGENISTSYDSAFTAKKGTQYLSSTGWVTIAPASGYSLNYTGPSGIVTNPAGYSYQIIRDTANNDNFMLMIGTPSGNQVINLSALGIISQLIGGSTTPTTPTSSESTGSSSDNDSTSESVSDSSGESGLPAGWTPASDTIYRLIEAAHKRAVDQGSSVVMVDLGDNPSFDENAARSLIDKAGSNGSDCIFTVDGKAYNLIIPGGITPEQREALMRLLAQEPGGTAGPMRLVQLLNQVGVNASDKELTGGELFNRIMGVTGSQMNTESQVSAPGSNLYRLYYKLDGKDYSRANYRVIIQDPDPKTSEKYGAILNGGTVTGPIASVQGPLTATQPAINPAITGNGEPVTETTAGVNTSTKATSKHVIALKLSDSEPAISPVIRKNTSEATIPDSDTTTQKAQATGPVSAGDPSTRFNDSGSNVATVPVTIGKDAIPTTLTFDVPEVQTSGSGTVNIALKNAAGTTVATLPITIGKASIPTTLIFDVPQVSISEGQTPASNEKATSKHVIALKVTDSQPAISAVVKKLTEPVTEPTAGVQETTVSQTAMEAQTGTSSGWTPEAEKIYSLMDAGRKQAINSGSNVVSVELGDKPNFNENAARSLIDKAASGGSDSMFTADGKAYNLVVPGGVTVEQREALMKLLAQEPGGTAGPIRLAQLLNQVGVNASVKELNGGDLFNRMMGVTGSQMNTESQVSAPGSYLYKPYLKLDGYDYSIANYRVIIQDPNPKISEKFAAILNGEPERDTIAAGQPTLKATINPAITGNEEPERDTIAAGQQTLKATQPAINPAITGNGEPVTEPTAGVQETTVSQTIVEAPNGTASGWTPEAERIYTLVDTAQKQSIQNGNSVAQVDLGDKPNFDEKATRSFIDKLNTSGADLKFTADGKAYNINVPAGTTVEQREALINLLKQEPNGEAGPARLAQLMQQVGINATFTERSGRDLVAEFTNNGNFTEKTPAMATTPTLQRTFDVDDGKTTQKATSKHVVTLKVTDSQPAINVEVKKNTSEATEFLPITVGEGSLQTTLTFDTPGERKPEGQTPASNEKATSKHVIALKVMDSQPAINPAITGNGEPVTEPTAGVQETTVSQTIVEAPNGTSSGWTPEAERIYTLVDTAQKQSIQNGNSVAQVDLGDKPNFDEKATRSFIDKLNTSGADLKFTTDGKAYNINVPAGTTVEQREALINLLKQEPNGEAGPARLAQLMQQVGINITFTERSGRDLVNEFTGNALGEKTFKYEDTSVKVVIKESNVPVQATKSVKAGITLKNSISAESR